jgi:hypothetical protein
LGSSGEVLAPDYEKAVFIGKDVVEAASGGSEKDYQLVEI